jgi:molybdopterin converting factor small subunit
MEFEVVEITVLLFSHLRLALKKRRLKLDLPAEATVGAVIERIRTMVGDDLESVIVDKERGGYRLSATVNGQHADPGKRLQSGDEVTLLSPISGG